MAYTKSTLMRLSYANVLEKKPDVSALFNNLKCKCKIFYAAFKLSTMLLGAVQRNIKLIFFDSQIKEDTKTSNTF